MDYKNIEKSLDAIIRTGIILEYSEAERDSTPIGFNIFSAISDTFYRENFHSDILKSFLSTNSGSDNGFGQHKSNILIFLKKVSVRIIPGVL